MGGGGGPQQEVRSVRHHHVKNCGVQQEDEECQWRALPNRVEDFKSLGPPPWRLGDEDGGILVQQ